jgi:TetR/AcrR family transcriptional repressor of nem operon
MLSKRDEILEAAKAVAQAHGYNGLNFRDLASAVGVKSASVHYYFPTKGDLGAALAARYREEAREVLGEPRDPYESLTRYVAIFRQALERDNRMCLCGLMAAEYDDLPDAVKVEVTGFADDNVAWLTRVLALADPSRSAEALREHAFAIYASIGGAQLTARGRNSLALYDSITKAYRSTGLIPSRPAR